MGLLVTSEMTLVTNEKLLVTNEMTGRQGKIFWGVFFGLFRCWLGLIMVF